MFQNGTFFFAGYIMNHFDNQISMGSQGQSFNIKHRFHVLIYDSSWINKHPLTRNYSVPVPKGGHYEE